MSISDYWSQTGLQLAAWESNAPLNTLHGQGTSNNGFDFADDVHVLWKGPKEKGLG